MATGGHPPTRPKLDDAAAGNSSDDDELSNHDLDVLNTDYQFQRNLNFYAARPEPSKSSSITAPQVIKTRGSGRSIYETSDSEEIDDDDWDRPLRQLPLQASSRQQRYHRKSGYQTNAYQTYQGRHKPLIDFIKNEWKHTTSDFHSPASPTSDFTMPVCFQICFAPKFQRIFFVLLALSFLMWANWKTWAGPQWHENTAIALSVQDQLSSEGSGYFGQNLHPDFIDMMHLQFLDRDHVPLDKSSDRRLIVIGDVHGCYDELVALLSEIQYEARTDHLVFTGDLISRGPSSGAVVDLAISAKASCVRGNHEDRVLLAHRDILVNPSFDLNMPPPPPPGAPPPTEGKEPAKGTKGEDKRDLTQEEIDEEAFTHGDINDRRLAHELNAEQVAYLTSCPVILSLGQIIGLGETLVAHAGLVPGVPVERQDPIGVMQMRTLDLRTFVPSANRPAGISKTSPSPVSDPSAKQEKGKSRDRGSSVYWYKLWNKYQTLLPETHRSTVIYGHDSHVGLNIEKYSKGLDSGCVRGGRLSALILEGKDSSPATSASFSKAAKVSVGVSPRIVSVACRNYEKD